MKLLVCTSEYYPHGSGIANVAYNVVESFKKMGIDCTVCSPTGPDIYLGNWTLIKKYGRLGILYYWFKVHTFFKNDQTYNIAWLHQPLFLFKNPFVKSITTMHITSLGHSRATKKLGYSIFLRLYYYVATLIEKYCTKKIANTTKFVTDSPQVSLELLDVIGEDTNVLCIPNGVDVNRFKPTNDKNKIRSMLNIPNNYKVFLTVGRLSPQKKLFTMLDIFSKMQTNINECLLIISGKGELYSELNDYIKYKKIQNVQLRGYVPEESLIDLYACADYYITTSEYEGLPLTLLEAMSSGLPCIVSDIPNLNIVKEANCGIIINFSDYMKAAEDILNYIKNNNYGHGKNAREYAVDNLDWDIISKKYMDLFYNL